MPVECGEQAFEQCRSLGHRAQPLAQDACAIEPSRICPKSRGLPRPATTRPSARAISGNWRNAARVLSRSSGASWNHCTSANRASIAPLSINGAERSAANCRAPAPVIVRSTSASNEPVRPPPLAERVISRLSLVAWSISKNCCTSRRTGTLRKGILPCPTCSR